MIWLFVACSGPDSAGGPAVAEPTGGCGTPEGVITLTTRDGVTLEGDFRPAATCGAGAVLLLHMIPPSNDRTNWPRSFQNALVEAGFAVLALDRRGAGGSAGTAEDAYLGPLGKFDAQAGALFLRDEGYGPLTLLGASNGTTTVVDYAGWARGEGSPVPVALGFLTGGTYTENQTAMSRVPDVPSVFTYSTAERAWSEEQRGLSRADWTFLEYPDGDHGTRMFDAVPSFQEDLVGFVTTAATGN